MPARSSASPLIAEMLYGISSTVVERREAVTMISWIVAEMSALAGGAVCAATSRPAKIARLVVSAAFTTGCLRRRLFCVRMIRTPEAICKKSIRFRPLERTDHVHLKGNTPAALSAGPSIHHAVALARICHFLRRDENVHESCCRLASPDDWVDDVER